MIASDQTGLGTHMLAGFQTGLLRFTLGLSLLSVGSAVHAADETYKMLRPNATIKLCPTVAAPIAQCASLEGGSGGLRLTVIQSFRNAVGNRTYLRVRSVVGEDGFIDGADAAIASGDPIGSRTDAVAAGPCQDSGSLPQIGMTRAQVDASCWGKPAKIVTTSTLTLQQEDYFYENGRVLRLVNGLVSLKIDQR